MAADFAEFAHGIVALFGKTLKALLAMTV